MGASSSVKARPETPEVVEAIPFAQPVSEIECIPQDDPGSVTAAVEHAAMNEATAASAAYSSQRSANTSTMQSVEWLCADTDRLLMSVGTALKQLCPSHLQL